mmetsp:Transcript_1924/g.5643  ORF Transcript_1924/g.5643 Transcript_1924/m.5643 type:complete len:399 (+) Transcript_1924:695-1891(+)
MKEIENMDMERRARGRGVLHAPPAAAGSASRGKPASVVGANLLVARAAASAAAAPPPGSLRASLSAATTHLRAPGSGGLSTSGSRGKTAVSHNPSRPPPGQHRADHCVPARSLLQLIRCRAKMSAASLRPGELRSLCSQSDARACRLAIRAASPSLPAQAATRQAASVRSLGSSSSGPELSVARAATKWSSRMSGSRPAGSVLAISASTLWQRQGEGMEPPCVSPPLQALSSAPCFTMHDDRRAVTSSLKSLRCLKMAGRSHPTQAETAGAGLPTPFSNSERSSSARERATSGMSWTARLPAMLLHTFGSMQPANMAATRAECAAARHFGHQQGGAKGLLEGEQAERRRRAWKAPYGEAGGRRGSVGNKAAAVALWAMVRCNTPQAIGAAIAGERSAW